MWAIISVSLRWLNGVHLPSSRSSATDSRWSSPLSAPSSRMLSGFFSLSFLSGSSVMPASTRSMLPSWWLRYQQVAAGRAGEQGEHQARTTRAASACGRMPCFLGALRRPPVGRAAAWDGWQQRDLVGGCLSRRSRRQPAVPGAEARTVVGVSRSRVIHLSRRGAGDAQVCQQSAVRREIEPGLAESSQAASGSCLRRLRVRVEQDRDGPSLTSATSMCAPNTPVSTCAPSSLRAAQNAS